MGDSSEANVTPDPVNLQEIIDRAQAAAKRIEELESTLAAHAANAKLYESTAKAASESAASLSGEIAPTLTQAKASLEAATKASAEIPPILEQIKKSSGEVPPILEQVKTSRGEVLGLLEIVKTDSAKTAEIARIANEKDQRVAEYEKQLAELAEKYRELDKQLHELLPAATGVGLAKSFHERKASLRRPITIYFVIFLLSVIGFIALGVNGLFVEKVQNLQDFFRFVLERSPIIVGLILLEEFSRRQFAATVKLEEDYAFKETLSIAFDGYKKAMLEVQGTPAESLTALFSKSVIDTLRERPGRLLEVDEKHILPLMDFLERAAGASGKDEAAKVIPDVFRTARSALQIAWMKRAATVILILLLGLGLGYYFATKNLGAHIETAVSITPSQLPSNKPIK